MTNEIPYARRIELLTNAAISERYVQRALLEELVEELGGDARFARAKRVALTMLRELERGSPLSCVSELGRALEAAVGEIARGERTSAA